MLDLTNVARNKFRLLTLLTIRNIIGFSLLKDIDVKRDPKSSDLRDLESFSSFFRDIALFKDIYPIFDKFRDNTSQKESYTSRLLNRLAIFPDGLGKLRYVALSDFPTQSVLKSLHTLIFKLLRKTNSDATFNQGKIYD